jgi:hypothetical protein
MENNGNNVPTGFVVVGKIVDDAVYRYKFGSLYRTCGFYRDPHTNQDKVAYVGLDGVDAGRHFAVTFNDFVMRFSLVEGESPPAEAESKPGKPAGSVTHGSGY